MKGPDHAASLEPNELKQMIDYIREVENIMGNGIKKCLNQRKKFANARKSIIAAKKIKKGEVFSTII